MEGDAGTRQLNPTDADEALDESLAAETPRRRHPAPESPPADSQEVADDRRPSRLGGGWVAAICAGLLVLAGAGAVAGYLALKANQQNQDSAREEAAALQAARDCVAATHAPDVTAMSAAQSKIIECSTGDFGAQASLYSGVLVDAYQAANVTVQVSDMRAAVERHNDDGSFEVLVAVQVRVTNSETADQEQGYRLRLQMAPADGAYKIAQLDQVTS
jgi:Mce-associated membrane protein